MARIVETPDEPIWSARIRCAHPAQPRVDGCFSVIEITLEDILGERDDEGYGWTFWVICPKCGQRLYPEWQIGAPPLLAARKRLEAKPKR